MSLLTVHDANAHPVSHTYSARDHPPGGAAEDAVMIPKYALAADGVSARVARQIVQDECLIDGQPNLNLASFVTTWMEDEAQEILNLGAGKNLGDILLYPATHELQERCVNILAHLWRHAEPAEQKGAEPGVSESEATEGGAKSECGGAVGNSTIGSSEAVLLAALAMKWRWRQWRAEKKKKEGKSTLTQSSPTPKEQPQREEMKADKETAGGMLKGEGWATSEVLSGEAYGPGSDEPACNMIISAASHVSVLKACKYFDIQPRIIPLEHGRCVMTPDLVRERLDENTVGVMAILGTTLTGECDPIEQIHDTVAAFNREHGTRIALHIDAASGGFILPFTKPELRWDFRLEWVRSINASGHKYGQVYPGIGWIVWKDKRDLPEDLVFHINYLGSPEPTYTLNFSRSAAHVLLQYYMLVRLGRSGFKQIAENCLANARYLAQQLQSMGVFEILSVNLNKETAAAQQGGEEKTKKKKEREAARASSSSDSKQGKEQGAKRDGGEDEKNAESSESEWQPTIPIVVARLKNEDRLRDLLGFDLFELSHELQTRGWIIPAYTLPKECDDITVMRVVVRENMGRETCDLLLHDIKHRMVDLMKRKATHADDVRHRILSELGLEKPELGEKSRIFGHDEQPHEVDTQIKGRDAAADLSADAPPSGRERLLARVAEDRDARDDLAKRILESAQSQHQHTIMRRDERNKEHRAKQSGDAERGKKEQQEETEPAAKEPPSQEGGGRSTHKASRVHEKHGKQISFVPC